MIRPCDACGQPYEAKRPDRSRFCSARCRTRAHRAPAVAAVPVEYDPAASDLVDTVTRTLADAGQLGSVLGQVAVALATAMGEPAQTGAAVATLSKELRVVMSEVSATTRKPDIVDELRRRREARLARS